MAKAKAKKAKKWAAEAMWDYDPTGGDPFAGIEPDESGKETKEKPEFDASALIARLDALEAQNRSLSEANRMLMMQPAPQAAPQQRQAPQFNVQGMPDPVTDPTAYSAEMARRMMEYQSEVAAYNSAPAPQQTYANRNLMEEFLESHPEYAPFRDRVEFIGLKVSNKAAKRGMDVNKYAFGATEQFFADAMQEYEKTFGKPGVVDEDEDEGDEPDNSRSISMLSGQRHGEAFKAQKEGSESLGTLTDDLREKQTKLRIF